VTAEDQNKHIAAALGALGKIILGKSDELALALSCILGRGHLLIEDLPGLGKTTLAQALARVLGLSFQRIQFTSDLLPADIAGVSVFDREKGEFQFKPGPIFAQLVLADEVNRATPKAQSALLEAMEEQQVSVDGTSHQLPAPFFVIATQNPSDQIGTFPLPESQLDRFLMRIELGYPNEEDERALLVGRDRRELLETFGASLSAAELSELQCAAGEMHMSDALLDYVQALIRFTRESSEITTGLSPRAALSLIRAAKAYAFIKQHSGVYPDDIQAVFPAVAGHRMKPANNSIYRSARDLSRYVLDSVAIP
jgi:MoxR-like ATPase